MSLTFLGRAGPVRALGHADLVKGAGRQLAAREVEPSPHASRAAALGPRSARGGISHGPTHPRPLRGVNGKKGGG